jgi:uncharacterized membrane protein
MVTRAKLMNRVNRERVVEAIRDAERRTSGEIRVAVSTLIWGNVERAAQKAFARSNMQATKNRNAVLFFVVPSRRLCVVWGDSGIHQKVGEPFWRDTVLRVAQSFRSGDFTDGLVSAVGMVGDRLAAHYPRETADVNELPDELC